MKKQYLNRIDLSLAAISANEAVARSIVGVALSMLDPTVEELADMRCAVSEAVTNAIVHGYKNGNSLMAAHCAPKVYISVRLYSDRSVAVEIRDRGVGIADVEKAREPLYTTDETGERSGMGFAVMEAFTDSVRVTSRLGYGTRVLLSKKLSDAKEKENADV